MRKTRRGFGMSRRTVGVLPLVAAAVALTCGGTARADMLTWQGGAFSGGDSGVNGYDLASIANTYTGNAYSTPVANQVGAGADRDSTTQTMLETYCVDVGHFISGSATAYNLLSDTNAGTINYFGTLDANGNTSATGTSIIHQLEELASNSLSKVTDVNSSAAFQLAVWDIAFNNGQQPTTNNFTSVESGANASIVNPLVASYLSNLSGPITEKLTFLQDPGNTSQNLVTFTPVPLPPTAWLLLGALGGLALAGRRRLALLTP